MEVSALAEVQVRQCVITTLTRRGAGTADSVVRSVVEIWDVGTGEKLGEYDSYAPHWDIAMGCWVFQGK